MTWTAGLDSGSTTTKLVLLKGKELKGWYLSPTGTNSFKSGQTVLANGLADQGVGKDDIKFLVTTGYGRENITADKQMSEIICHARGVKWLFPSVDAIIDIGGQDFKVIKLNKQGQVLNFAMNDKCSAGTGRYLDLMANIFGMDLNTFSQAANLAQGEVIITSVCTVFAQTEVISHISRGTGEEEIIAGIFAAVARRVLSLFRQVVGEAREIVFTGGVAKNTGVAEALEKATGYALQVPLEPQITGALGAALLAREFAESAGFPRA